MGPDLNTQIHHVTLASTPPGRMPSTQLIVEHGDVVVSLEVAGIWRSGPGLTAPTTETLSEYRLEVHGEPEAAEHTFEVYDGAVASGDALAANRSVRLFYAEGDALTLLKDYRPGSRL